MKYGFSLFLNNSCARGGATVENPPNSASPQTGPPVLSARPHPFQRRHSILVLGRRSGVPTAHRLPPPNYPWRMQRFGCRM
jgi:hypothetical protein